ncbi:MAG TPA: spermine synthase [Luteimonas sp.]
MSGSDRAPVGTARDRRLFAALLLLFVPSGIAGLVYQSIWSHYLGLTLGHAAYAQTLVLGIFMGGMALGAWLCSRFEPGARRLLVGYAVVEAVIGVAGLVFHPVFEAYTGLSQAVVLPALSGSGLTSTWQWLSAGLLILPQCILLGATFPLLSAGLLKTGLDADGRVLGGLYFYNSLGAALGALLATFVLLPALGLAGTVALAGWINLMVALVALLIARALPVDAGARVQAQRLEGAMPPLPAAAAPDPGVARFASILLVAAFATGATSFVYEIGWIRLLNQALGTTVHSFELMLAAFILGLAFGGLWVRRRTGPSTDALRLFGYAQVAMAIAAMLSIVVFTQSFRWVGWIQAAVARGDEGYQLYSLATAAVCLAVMFPAAFFAGMTLPLCTMALLRRGAGTRVVGQVYAANTLGAIAGVVLMVHVLVPVAGVRNGILVAALGDAALGVYLLRLAGVARSPLVLPAFATVAALWVAMVGGRIDPHQQVAGVFRTGVASLPGSARINAIVDGKTATVASIEYSDGYTSITTNGKPDAMLARDRALPHTADEPTMVLAGLLPLVHHPDPKRVAVIGWGSGLSTHTLAGSTRPALIESIEIEPAMVEVARIFGDRVGRAYADPRSRIVYEDARTHFAAAPSRYDVVVSEPSNPWVSGVANLFTLEFYRLVQRHLNEGGVLVQWLQVYELDEPLFATMLAALLEVFPDTRVYLANSSDVILVAHNGRRLATSGGAFAEPLLAPELQRLGLGGFDALSARCLGGGRLLRAHVHSLAAQPNSDYRPTVSLLAPRARFRGDQAGSLFSVAHTGLPVLDALEGRRPAPASRIPADGMSLLVNGVHRARAIATALRAADPASPALSAEPVYARDLALLLGMSTGVIAEERLPAWSDALANVADGVVGLLGAAEQRALWAAPDWITALERQPALVGDMLEMYAAAAERDWSATGVAARKLLADRSAGAGPGPYAREHAYLLARLAAIGEGRPGEAQALADAHADAITVSKRMQPVHRLIDGWLDTGAATVGDAGPPPDACTFQAPVLPPKQ